jgi:hypothetical protein
MPSCAPALLHSLLLHRFNAAADEDLKVFDEVAGNEQQQEQEMGEEDDLMMVDEGRVTKNEKCPYTLVPVRGACQGADWCWWWWWWGVPFGRGRWRALCVEATGVAGQQLVCALVCLSWHPPAALSSAHSQQHEGIPTTPPTPDSFCCFPCPDPGVAVVSPLQVAELADPVEDQMGFIYEKSAILNALKQAQRDRCNWVECPLPGVEHKIMAHHLKPVSKRRLQMLAKVRGKQQQQRDAGAQGNRVVLDID